MSWRVELENIKIKTEGEEEKNAEKDRADRPETFCFAPTTLHVITGTLGFDLNFKVCILNNRGREIVTVTTSRNYQYNRKYTTGFAY